MWFGGSGGGGGGAETVWAISSAMISFSQNSLYFEPDQHLFVKLSLNKFFANFIHLSSHLPLMSLFSLNVCLEYVEFLSFIYFLCPLPCALTSLSWGHIRTVERPTILTPRGNLEFPVCLTCMFLGCGGGAAWLLRGDCANHCTAMWVSSYAFCIFVSIPETSRM